MYLNHLEVCSSFLLVFLVKIVYERIIIINTIPPKKLNELNTGKEISLISGKSTNANRYGGGSATPG